ncbi:MAG TPA: cation:proton antiporter [Candidatus Saccharimonadales bacterium]|nr:cation:proton antiporter [Candidatus Saccharimonadales bacterium]
MLDDVFVQLSLVIVAAGIVSIIMRLLKQPLIMGYIITGILVGPSLLHLIHEKDAFEVFSEIGIALLLFIIGLELSITTIRRLGKPVFVTAFALFSVMVTMGYLIGIALGFTTAEAIITGLAIFFSSTIIIAKVLSDKKQLTRMNGQLAIGIILVDDIVATFALLYVTTNTGGGLGALDIGFLALKGIATAGLLVLLGAKILPKFTKFIASSQELLFIFALAWGFGIATLVNAIGFSVEIGALFAGVALAHLPYVHQIGAKLKPLRDFFIILFFISLGESLELHNLATAVVPALILSIATLLIKPLVVMISLGLLRYTKRTSFMTGINLSQISEFSIILVVLAHSSGMVGAQLSAIITLVAIITISTSTYLMKYDDWLFRKLEKNLHLFERSVVNESQHRAKEYPIVMFGYLNGGDKFIKTFRAMRQRFVVIDYDPEVIEELERKHIEFLYGDATDPELLADIDFEKTKLVVNTIADHFVNVALVRHVHHHNPHATMICYSNDRAEAAELYKLGASYVMLPHFIGSEQLSSFIHTHGLSKQSFEVYRNQQSDIHRYE